MENGIPPFFIGFMAQFNAVVHKQTATKHGTGTVTS